jgi:RimJ/RimL family protein N-acetyltransferase
MDEIRTDRLVITVFTPEMARAVHRNSLDEDVRRFVPDEVFETEEDARDTVEFLISRCAGTEGPFVYPVLLKTGENVGYVQLVPCEEGWEIGYHIAKAFTGRGYATEAVRAFLPVMAAEHGLTEIYGTCIAENAASVRVLEKCGFTVLFRGEGAYQGQTREIVKTVWKTPEEETMFECRYTWDEKITEEVMRALVLRRPQSVLLFVLVGCMIPASIGAAVWIYRLSGKIDVLSCIAVAVSCLLPAAFLFILFRAGRPPRDETKDDVEVTLTVTEKGIACRDTSGDAPAFLPFGEIRRVYDVKSALVLQMRDNITCAFVREGFTKGTPEELKRFLREQRRKKPNE